MLWCAQAHMLIIKLDLEKIIDGSYLLFMFTSFQKNDTEYLHILNLWALFQFAEFNFLLIQYETHLGACSSFWFISGVMELCCIVVIWKKSWTKVAEIHVYNGVLIHPLALSLFEFTPPSLLHSSPFFLGTGFSAFCCVTSSFSSVHLVFPPIGLTMWSTDY
jgi:hypothetical protein